MRKVVLLSTVLFLLFAPAVLADEPAEKTAEEKSPAAKTYGEAWFTETATRDLKRALELYERALEEEGSAHVKARALFRRAMVLERVGKTEEAIRTFERLVKTHPDETDLHEKARRHMESWTSEDLKGSFDAWYERYQYSPEFQAKVVDLVLRLGSKSGQQGYAAEESELLTIGKAALPALRRHVDTRNEQLRDRAARVMLQLGEVPSVEALLESRLWWSLPDAWKTLLTLPADRAAALSEAVATGDGIRAVLREVVKGPDAALALFEAPQGDPFNRRSGPYLLQALLARPGGKPTLARLEHLARAAPTRDQWARYVVEGLLERGRASDDLLLHVLRHGPAYARQEVMKRIQDGSLRQHQAWRALSEAVLEEPSLLWRNSSTQDAFFKAVGHAPDDADLDLAARAFAAGIPPKGKGSLNTRASQSLRPEDHIRGVERLVPVVLASIDDEDAQMTAVWAWGPKGLDPGPGGADAWSQLLTWARDLASPSVGRAAAQGAASILPATALPVALARLPELTAEAAESFLRSAEWRFRENESVWTDEALRRVLEELRRIEAADVESRAPVITTLVETEPGARRVIDLVLAEPERLATRIPLDSNLLNSEALQAHVRQALQAGWEHWSPPARLAALQSVASFDGDPDPDAPYVAWVREQIRAPYAWAQAELVRPVRKGLLGLLPEATAEDLGVVFQLDDPAEAHEAGLLWNLEASPASYEAVQAGRRVEDVEQRRIFWQRWTGHPHAKRWTVDPEARRRALLDMVKDEDPGLRAAAFPALASYRKVADVTALVAGLRDIDARVRQEAAKSLALVYDRSAIQALAERLDDPDLAVRDAVLATLESIKKAEEAKDYWKKFAEER